MTVPDGPEIPQVYGRVDEDPRRRASATYSWLRPSGPGKYRIAPPPVVGLWGDAWGGANQAAGAARSPFQLPLAPAEIVKTFLDRSLR